jgi:hypothetical protein
MAKISGGEKLEARLKELAEKVSNPGTLRVGFLEGSTYPDGTSVPMVAAIHNFGAPGAGIPPRPFFSNVVAKGRRTWGAALVTLLEQNNYDAKKSLRMMGEGIKGEIQKEITNGSFAPLKPATVRRKGFDKPLVDTGHMLNSVDYEVT